MAYPVSPGHALLVTKRHVSDWFAATPEELRELTDAVGLARAAILRRHSPDGFNIGSNVGAAAGQTVPHLHLHVIPRYAGDVADPYGGIRAVIPGRARYDAASDQAGAVRDEAAGWSRPQGAARGADAVPDAEAGAVVLPDTDFGERLLQLLDEGQFSATYKFAVLLGLIELCLEQGATPGAAVDLTTRALAEKVIALYWPQTAPFVGIGPGKVLAQNRGGQAEIVAAICRFRDQAGADPGQSLWRTRTVAPERYARLVDLVEWKLIEMPLPKLQRVGRIENRFLYYINWDDHVRRADIASPGFDRQVHLLPGVADHLIRLAGLLRPLIQRSWAAMIAAMNRDATDEARLQEFLFGASRVCLDPIRQPLRELQDNRCFYCDHRMDGAVEIDHFLPWSRHADNGIRNLVAADARCNQHKRDFLAAGEHAQRWVERIDDRGPLGRQLADLARRTNWEDHSLRTLNAAAAIYRRLPDGVRLWRRGREFSSVAADRALLAAAFSAARPQSG